MAGCTPLINCVPLVLRNEERSGGADGGGVSKPRAQLFIYFRAQRSHLRFCQNRGTRLVCRVWITDLGALDEERVCGVWWPGFSVVGVLES